MRRNEKEIKDEALLENILNQAQVCRIAVCDNNIPYIVPMNFGYKNRVLFFHSAKEGRKIELLKKNRLAAFETETGVELLSSGKACSWGMKFFSVIGYGEVIFIDDPEEEIEALNIIVGKYESGQKFEFQESSLKKVLVFKIKIIEITGKKSGY